MSYCECCERKVATQPYGFQTYLSVTSTSHSYTHSGNTFANYAYQYKGHQNLNAQICDRCVFREKIRNVIKIVLLIGLGVGAVALGLLVHRTWKLEHGWISAAINALGPLFFGATALLFLLMAEQVKFATAGNIAAIRAHRRQLKQLGFRYFEPGHLHYATQKETCACEEGHATPVSGVALPKKSE